MEIVQASIPGLWFVHTVHSSNFWKGTVRFSFDGALATLAGIGDGCPIVFLKYDLVSSFILEVKMKLAKNLSLTTTRKREENRGRVCF